MPTLNPALFQTQLDFAREATSSAEATTQGSNIVRIGVHLNPETEVRDGEFVLGEKKPFSIRDLLPNAKWQEVRLIGFKAGNNKTKKHQALEELINAYSGYIRHIAKRRWLSAKRIGGDSGLNDIISAGREGLFIAINKWQPGKQPLCHLASVWITQNCKQMVTQLKQTALTIPPRIKNMCWEFNTRKEETSSKKAESYLDGSKCRDETKAIVRSLAPSITDNTLSMDAPVGPDESGPTVQDTLITESRNCDELADVIDNLRTIMRERFTPLERLIIYLLYPIPFIQRTDIGVVYNRKGDEIILPTDTKEKITLDRIGKYVGVTRERIRQIRNEVLSNLKGELAKIGVSSEVLALA